MVTPSHPHEFTKHLRSALNTNIVRDAMVPSVLHQ